MLLLFTQATKLLMTFPWLFVLSQKQYLLNCDHQTDKTHVTPINTSSRQGGICHCILFLDRYERVGLFLSVMSREKLMGLAKNPRVEKRTLPQTSPLVLTLVAEMEEEKMKRVVWEKPGVAGEDEYERNR